MAGVAFPLIAWTVLFIFSVWALGRLFKLCRMSEIIGEVLAGVLLGPNVFDKVPFASDGTCRCAHDGRWPQCAR